MHENLVKITEVGQLLPEKPSLSYLYRLTSQKLIPHVKKGRVMFFDKNEIIRWDDAGRPSVEEWEKIKDDK